MLKHILRLAVSVTLGLVISFLFYSILSPINEQLANLVAYGTLLSTPLPLALILYGKLSWAMTLFVGSWLAYIAAISALALWTGFEFLFAQGWPLALLVGGSVFALYVLYRTGKFEELLEFLGQRAKPEREPETELNDLGVGPVTSPMFRHRNEPEAEPRLKVSEPATLETAQAQESDLDQSVESLDGLECKILQTLLTTESTSSKKDLQLATGVTYRRIIASSRRLKDAGLIEVRKEIIRGRRGAVIRHSVHISSKIGPDKRRFESLLRKRMEQLEKWGLAEA
jgi:hypothetical protein